MKEKEIETSTLLCELFLGPFRPRPIYFLGPSFDTTSYKGFWYHCSALWAFKEIHNRCHVPLLIQKTSLENKTFLLVYIQFTNTLYDRYRINTTMSKIQWAIKKTLKSKTCPTYINLLNSELDKSLVYKRLCFYAKFCSSFSFLQHLPFQQTKHNFLGVGCKP